jgi:hypothetical protein
VSDGRLADGAAPGLAALAAYTLNFGNDGYADKAILTSLMWVTASGLYVTSRCLRQTRRELDGARSAVKSLIALVNLWAATLPPGGLKDIRLHSNAPSNGSRDTSNALPPGQTPPSS